ncbi:uncharacterized protein LOC130900423 isoform X1 [Diorhabda carinulata]|uniref:uncharacterized protein LOC130900423 isoform X1 n=1 Tax=Diorhabda carinulata TaxID=1163345 RepID=UPI0025A0BBE3|nr:uncharacterized protein LOC130900423 isoform X1 [Diorhabda carinulata]
MVFNCCVNGCNNYNKDAQMHIFPKDQILYDIWINAIGREDLKVKPMERVRKSYRICTIHFSAEARYVGTRNKSTLKQDAIPSLFLNASNRKEEATNTKRTKLSSSNYYEEMPPAASRGGLNRFVFQIYFGAEGKEYLHHMVRNAVMLFQDFDEYFKIFKNQLLLVRTIF